MLCPLRLLQTSYMFSIISLQISKFLPGRVLPESALIFACVH